MSDKYSSKTFGFTFSGFQEAMDAATEETIGDVKATVRSTMNKVIRSVKSLTSEEIRKRYNVPKAILDERLTLFTAKMSDLEATLVIGGRSVSLSYFGAKQFNRNVVTTRKGSTVRKRATKFQGVEVEVIRGRRTELKSAFFRRFKSGHLGIVTRTGKGRYPIRVMSAISIASMFNQVEINDAIVAKIDADLERLFWHELEFYLSRGSR